MTVEEFIDATQRAQAIGFQIAIEHMRRRKRQTSGVAVWQLNDCSPSISWSVIDYYGIPKRAYEELKRLYSPVLASFDYALMPRRTGDVVRGGLWLINDWRNAFENVELRAELNGKEIYARRVHLAPDSAEKIDALVVTLGEGENDLRLVVRDGDRALSDHAYDLNFCDVGEIGWIDWLMIEVGQRLVR
jgi:beta-mannosidase